MDIYRKHFNLDIFEIHSLSKQNRSLNSKELSLQKRIAALLLSLLTMKHNHDI